ncbi:TetR family transcriptional regulator [Cohnella thailandensis]|uniref:TetR/AcrR family transcriptional regulator n=1 Tax=Cohnella thailandensis TaxID=557557 RepID=A0A841STF5_9BACL|nr:TetR family transcriptional regulator [Cohnella thailandensis]MBB6633498.1 TetR/AcrR family transcriptional regulator [Cohnella thailandensis]MBP1974515.1 AcrR family transcriptional regulator [Cohnella thailandensis]
MESAEHDVKMRLLVAAKKLFSRQGFDGTTVRQICEEAGANVALVSYYFGGKDNMYRALFDMSFPESLLLEGEEAKQDPVKAIKLLIRKVIAYQANDPELVRLIQQESAQLTPRVAIVQKYLVPVWQMARDILEEGRHQGVFHFRSLDNTFLYVWGGILFPRDFGFFNPVIREPLPSTEEKIADVTRFVLGALGYNGDPEPETP